MPVENPLLLEMPLPIITPRLKIVAVDPLYAQEMHEAKIESHEHFFPWMVWAKETSTLDDPRAMMTQKKAAFLLRESLMMLVFTHEGQFVAATGYDKIDWDVPMAEIGYWCRKSAAGRGYVTEAVNALIRYAFDVLKMRKISVAMDSENHASEAVAKRLNMELEFEAAGLIKTLHPPENGLRICKSYACFNTEKLPPLDVQWSV